MTAQCPICQLFLVDSSESEIESHVLLCLQKGESEKPTKDFLCSVCNAFYEFGQVLFLDCGHFFCNKCLRSAVMNLIESKKCSTIICLNLQCKKSLTPSDLKQILNQVEYDLYIKNSLAEVVSSDSNFVHCPKEDCSNIIQMVNSGKEPSSPQEHKERFRFRCRECSCEFCGSCLTVPYHEGYTCIQYKKFKEAKHCRFCGDQLNSTSNSIITKLMKSEALIEVCQKPDCKSRADLSCTKQLPCKHFCGGVIREKTCLPCLNPDCRSKEGGQTGEDYCNICWVEDLKSAPAIQLQCGHVFHYQCVENQLTKRWHTTNISFGFCDCPLCSRWISHPSLQELMTPIEKLYNEIKEKATQRLKFQNFENAKEIVNEGEIFYKNPTGYALKRFCYYPCYKCKKPYFGGERACNAELLVNPNFNPAELLCGGCSAGDNKQNCNKHGTDYIVWKCKFCCQIACWFCWGNTHFCEDCHKQAVKISQTPRDQLPTCNCQVEHPPNGEEHCFGCSLCLANTTNF